MTDYRVDLTIETTSPITMDILEDVAFVGGAASGNPGDRRLGTILTVEAGNPGEAITRAVEALPISGFIVAAEVMTVEEADRRLEEPSFPDLAGEAEVAEMLGVSRQRLSVLRERPDFPAPVVHLAAGPVWRKRDLTTFASGWQRRPGRPRLSA